MVSNPFPMPVILPTRELPSIHGPSFHCGTNLVLEEVLVSNEERVPAVNNPTIAIKLHKIMLFIIDCLRLGVNELLLIREARLLALILVD
jgi:hypothetical protein